jgi:hypothetical protein
VKKEFFMSSRFIRLAIYIVPVLALIAIGCHKGAKSMVQPSVPVAAPTMAH